MSRIESLIANADDENMMHCAWDQLYSTAAPTTRIYAPAQCDTMSIRSFIYQRCDSTTAACYTVDAMQAALKTVLVLHKLRVAVDGWRTRANESTIV